MNLIIPISGKSSRYPNVKPKWMLAHPNGNFMVIESISGLNLKQFKRIIFVHLKEHEDIYNFKKGFVDELEKNQIKNYEFCALENQTKDVTETVIQAIKIMNIEGSIFIKDSDSYFSCDNIPQGDFVFYSHLKNTKCTKPAGSSYIVLDENNIITNIVEKQIISPHICVGGYLFESASSFLEIASNIDSVKERYISDIIYFSMLYNKQVFRGVEIYDLEDWGTLDDWKAYKKQFATLFLDIDGVIVNHSSTHFPPYIATSLPIEENLNYLKSLDPLKVEIILTTSRTEEYRSQTEIQLKGIGLKYKQLVMGLRSNKRIIINDYSPTNEYRNCDAVNLKRNNSNLEELLNSSLK